MKKLLKKVLTLSLCISMMAVMATSASAAENIVSKPVLLDRNYAHLNVYGNNIATDFRNVCLWTSDGGTAQQWKVEVVSSGKHRLVSNTNTSFSLNIDERAGQTNNAIIYRHANDPVGSSILVSQYQSSATYATGFLITSLKYPTLVLASESFTSESTNNCQNVNVKWKTASQISTDSYKVWDALGINQL